MEQYTDQSAYFILKDHKENFKTRLPSRLINPAKSDIGLVSKGELEKINRSITSQTKCNQWRNIQAVINWFKSIPNKTKAQFIKFDIIEFCPSIPEKLLDSTVSYAQTLSIIPNDVIQAIKQARKSFLFTEGNIWMKKGKIPYLMLQ